MFTYKMVGIKLWYRYYKDNQNVLLDGVETKRINEAVKMVIFLN